jgi:hypothetical protein
MNSKELETLIDRELKELPQPPAPPALLPRVLAAVERQLERSTSPWRWSNWSPIFRVVSAGTVGVFMVGLTFLEPMAQGFLTEALAIAVQPVVEITGDLWTAFSAADALRRALLEPVFGYLVALGFMMGTACAGLGAALTRMAGLGGHLR